jgi:hypothetical protein
MGCRPGALVAYLRRAIRVWPIPTRLLVKAAIPRKGAEYVRTAVRCLWWSGLEPNELTSSTVRCWSHLVAPCTLRQACTRLSIPSIPPLRPSERRGVANGGWRNSETFLESSLTARPSGALPPLVRALPRCGVWQGPALSFCPNPTFVFDDSMSSYRSQASSVFMCLGVLLIGHLRHRQSARR